MKRYDIKILTATSILLILVLTTLGYLGQEKWWYILLASLLCFYSGWLIGYNNSNKL